MKYIARKGIILTDVGSQPILVSAASLRGVVPYVAGINETTAFCWNKLLNGVSEEELEEYILEEYETDSLELVREDIHNLIEDLKSKGYIIEQEETGS